MLTVSFLLLDKALLLPIFSGKNNQGNQTSKIFEWTFTAVLYLTAQVLPQMDMRICSAAGRVFTSA